MRGSCKKWVMKQNPRQITPGEIQANIYCEADHKYSTNSQNKNVNNFTFNATF